MNPSIFFSGSERSFEDASFYYEDLAASFPNPEFHPILVTLEPKESDGKPFSHTGHEFVFVVKGTLTLKLHEEELTLGEGESKYYSSNQTHYWYNYTDEPIQFLVVSTR